jgi:hypothetical protein
MLNNLVLALALVYQPTPPATFDVQVELQGLYDEISQANLEFVSELDASMFHGVVCTPDWFFVDATGRKQTWQEVHDLAGGAPSAPLPDSIDQQIQKLTLTPDGAVAIVTLTTIRTIVDTEGRYGRPGATHTLTETSTWRDAWVRVADTWKQQSREQMGRPVVKLDKPEWRI